MFDSESNFPIQNRVSKFIEISHPCIEIIILNRKSLIFSFECNILYKLYDKSHMHLHVLQKKTCTNTLSYYVMMV